MAAQEEAPKGQVLQSLARSVEFWGRAVSIYAGYKACQAHALLLRGAGWSTARLKDEHWARQHSKAAEQLYRLCVDLRGFYLKVGAGGRAGLLATTYRVACSTALRHLVPCRSVAVL